MSLITLQLGYIVIFLEFGQAYHTFGLYFVPYSFEGLFVQSCYHIGIGDARDHLLTLSTVHEGLTIEKYYAANTTKTAKYQCISCEIYVSHCDYNH